MEQTAKLLFEKFLNGTCSQKELDRLLEILRTNEQEVVFRSMLEKVYQDIDRSLSSDTYVAGPGTEGKQFQALPLERPDGDSKAKPRQSALMYVFAIAACLLLALGVVYFWKAAQKPAVADDPFVAAGTTPQVDPIAEGKYKNQKTARAEQKYLLLPDGTQVWLNAESSLIVPDEFEADKRVVYLKGEAFFDVKHAEKIPFVIHMPNNVTTTVLGTAFDIKAYGEKEFSVTVKRGKVQVSKDRKALATLTVGQQIKMMDSQGIQPMIQRVKKENIASWTEGKLSYDALKLEDILVDLERVFNVRIELTNRKLSDEVITTSFDKGDGINSVLKTLCLLTGTNFKKDNQVYIIE